MAFNFKRIEEIFFSFEKNNPVLAPVLYQVFSSLTFALVALLLKVIKQISTAQILIVRSIITLLINGFIVMSWKLETYPVTRPDIYNKLIIRGLAGAIGTQLRFEGQKLLPISESVVLLKTTPFWTLLVSIFVLRSEKASLKTVLLVLVSLLAIVMIAKPPFFMNALDYIGLIDYQIVEGKEFSYHTFGVIICIVAAFISTIVQVLISSLSGDISQFAILQYFSFVTIPLAAIQLLYSPFEPLRTPNMVEWFYLFLTGILGCVGQWTMNRSFILGNLTQVSNASQSQVVFSFLIDVLILHESLNYLSVIGAGIIVTCLFFTIKGEKKKE